MAKYNEYTGSCLELEFVSNNHPIKCTYDHPTSTIPVNSTSSFDGVKIRAILDDCNSPFPEKRQRQKENHDGDGVAAAASHQQRKDETTVSTTMTSGNNSDEDKEEEGLSTQKNNDGPPLSPQMEGEDDNGSMINPTNADTTLTMEKKTSQRGSRGKNSRKQHNSRRSNRVGRNGGDGGGHGDNMRRRIS